MLERFGNVRMASVGVGGVEETEAVVVSVEQEIGEALDAKSSLMRVMSGADRAGAHGEAAGLNAGAAKSDCFGGGEFLAESLLGERVEDGFGKDPGRSRGADRADEEFAATHEASRRRWRFYEPTPVGVRRGRLVFSPQRTQGRSKSPPLRLRSGQALSHQAREGWGTLKI